MRYVSGDAKTGLDMRLLHVDRLTGTPARVLALRRARRRRRGRSHLQRRRLTRRHAVDVDVALRLPRRPHADARLRADARGYDGSVR